jgi:hypothetical protein
MGRKRTETVAGPESDHRHDFEHEHKPRRVRRLAVLMALAGGGLYLMRRNQRRASIDDGVWHEAPNA